MLEETIALNEKIDDVMGKYKYITKNFFIVNIKKSGSGLDKIAVKRAKRNDSHTPVMVWMTLPFLDLYI